MSWRNMSREYMSKSLQRTWKDQRLSVATKIRVYRVTGALCTYMLQKRNVALLVRYQKFQHNVMFECCLSALTQPHNRFATRSLPCR